MTATSPMLARLRREYNAERAAVPLSPASRFTIWRMGLPRRSRRIDALDARAAAADRDSRRQNWRRQAHGQPSGRFVVVSPHTPRPRTDA